MYLSENVIRILCKYGASFTVSYEPQEDIDFGSVISKMQAKSEDFEVLIKPKEMENGYMLEITEVNSKDISVKDVSNFESLCVELVRYKILPETAWF